MNETNPYLKRLDQIEAAKKQYYESEWRLSFLRTIESEPVKQLTEQEILKWHTQTSQQLARLN